MFYINKKGNKVSVSITGHAKRRFLQRWNALYPHDPMSDRDMPERLRDMFNASQRRTNLSRKEKTRLKRHGRDTMFFARGGFTFVVQDAQIVTVEIAVKELRNLNKSKVVVPWKDDYEYGGSEF